MSITRADNAAVNLGVVWPLWTGGRVRAAVGAARARTDAAEADLQQSVEQLLYEVGVAYYGVLRARLVETEAEAVTLVAVSKVQPEERVQAVIDAGHRVFGENRVQEAAGKWPAFRERFDGIELHLIGPLQTNKARQAMELAQAIHTLDRPKLARSLAKEMDRNVILIDGDVAKPSVARILGFRGGRCAGARGSRYFEPVRPSSP